MCKIVNKGEVAVDENLSKTYDPKNVEDKLYNFWIENGFFKAHVNKNKKPYTIVMPPIPHK